MLCCSHEKERKKELAQWALFNAVVKHISDDEWQLLSQSFHLSVSDTRLRWSDPCCLWEMMKRESQHQRTHRLKCWRSNFRLPLSLKSVFIQYLHECGLYGWIWLKQMKIQNIYSKTKPICSAIWTQYIHFHAYGRIIALPIQSYGGGVSSSTTSVQHPLGWCNGCPRTTAPVLSPHTSYRWRGERDRANQVYALTTHQLQVERRESHRTNQV